jgi:predicted helicase
MSEAKISYFSLQGLQGKDAKLDWIAGTRFEEIGFENINSDGKGNWINQTDNDFDSFLLLVDKEVKAGRSEEAVFKIFSRGLETGRDEWVYDFSKSNLSEKVKFLINNYTSCLNKSTFDNLVIKWDRELRRYLSSNVNKVFNPKQIVFAVYRPFVKKNIYFDRHFNRMPGLLFQIFPSDSLKLNLGITVSDTRFRAFFSVLAINKLPDLHLCATEDAFQCLPLYRYDENGDRIDNITDWGLTQFQTHYKDSKITKENIFHYTYAVLHHPAYRTKYELNLKREFPRLPFYEDFHQWAAWGKALMDLHLNYETIEPYGLQRVEIATKDSPKAKLKADKTNGVISLDDNTQLIGVEAIAWEYKLGNRSALEWILDQYKEKKPKDPTIAKLFNTYKFTDYKEQVIDLLQRVCTVSVKTMAIIHQMSAESS